MPISRLTASRGRTAQFGMLLGALGMLLINLPAMSAADYLYTHVAGPTGGPGNADGPPEIGRLNSPSSLALDRQGNLFVSDAGNRRIRRIAPDGSIETVRQAGQPLQFLAAYGLAVGPEGQLIVSDTNTQVIYRIGADGSSNPWAGQSYQTRYSGLEEFGDYRNGSSLNARFFRQTAIAFDRQGNLFVADTGNHVIRKVNPALEVSLFAGTPAVAGNVDAVGAAARFRRPSSLAFDATGNLYVGEPYCIRRVSPDGTVTTIAGSPDLHGSADGIGSEARFFNPKVAVAPNGDIIVADSGNHTIRRLAPDGRVTTLAGVAGQIGAQNGPGTQARFMNPSAVVVSPSGIIYVADNETDSIRQIDSAGNVSTYAGRLGGSGYRDATASEARFDEPWGITVDPAGNLFVADLRNRAVRKITPQGAVTTVPGQGGAGKNGFGSFMQGPSAIALDLQGNLVVAPAARDTVLKVSSQGSLLDMAGQPLLANDPSPRGSFGSYTYLIGAAVHPITGATYVADGSSATIWIFSTDGQRSRLEFQTAEIALRGPNGLAFDKSGNLYIADRTTSTINKVTPNGVLSVFAGSPNVWGHADGRGRDANFGGPCGVAVDREGNVIVADTGTNTIRQITPEGVVTTIGGQWGVYGSANGVGAAAHFFAPHAIAIDNDGTLFIAEEGNCAIRMGRRLTAPVILTHPLGQALTIGGNHTMTVAAKGLPEPAYQWQLNGTAISGATGSTLTLSNVTSANAGDYTVVVSNDLGSVTSNKATLTVTAAPPPPSSPPSGGGGGGGGGAPSVWFIAALIICSIARHAVRR